MVSAELRVLTVHNNAKPPTKAEQERIDKFRWIGCVVSHVFLNLKEVPYDVHHLVEGGKRLGHAFSIPLSPWFHRGIPPDGMNVIEATARYGPSLALNPKRFKEHFGTDRELLEATNRLIEAMERARAA